MIKSSQNKQTNKQTKKITLPTKSMQKVHILYSTKSFNRYIYIVCFKLNHCKVPYDVKKL